jgi:hypothetical protein
MKESIWILAWKCSVTDLRIIWGTSSLSLQPVSHPKEKKRNPLKVLRRPLKDKRSPWKVKRNPLKE